MSWTDDRINTLKKLWNDGESASAIARTLGEVTPQRRHRQGAPARACRPREPIAQTQRLAKAVSLSGTRAFQQNSYAALPAPALAPTRRQSHENAPPVLPELPPPRTRRSRCKA